MKSIFFSAFIFCQLSLQAQINVQRKIGQRTDYYQSSVWTNKDSFRWDYNMNAVRTHLTALKTVSPGVWQNFYKYTFTLDGKDSVVQQLRENWGGGNWVNNQRYAYSYDLDGNLLLINYDVWNGSSWNPAGKIEYAGYNSSKKYAVEQLYIWNGGAWQNLEKTNYQYYSNGYNAQFKENYNWNTSLLRWDKVDRYYYTYNLDSISSRTRSIGDTNNLWLEKTKESMTYSSVPFLKTQYLLQQWDTTAGANVWNNDSRIFYNYNPDETLDKTNTETFASANWYPVKRTQNIYNINKELIEFFSEINTGVWTNEKRKTFSYTNGKVAEEKSYKGVGSTWLDEEKLSFDYDINLNLTFSQVDSFNGAAYLPFRRDYYYYKEYIVGLQEEDPTLSPVILYPNPCSGLANFNLISNEEMDLRIDIFDEMGRIRQSILHHVLAGTKEVSVDVTGLSDATYFLRMVNMNTGAEWKGKLLVKQ